MVKQICFLEQLPDDFGSKGAGFKPYHDHAKTAGRIALRYASITGLCLSVLSFAVVMM